MTSHLVPIARFPMAADARAARSALEAAGVPAVLDSVDLSTAVWHLSTSIGVVLRVATEDRAAAEQLLSNTPFLIRPDGTGVNAPTASQPVCHDCGLAVESHAESCPGCGANIEPSATTATQRPSTVRGELVDDTGRPLTWMRRNLKWVIWMMTLPGIIAVGFGLVGMFWSILVDLLRPATMDPRALIKLLLSVVTTATLIALLVNWQRRSHS